METVVIPKYEYITMKQQIADLQKKIVILQDVTFMNKLKFFVDLFYKDFAPKKTDVLESVPFKFGAAKELISISDEFNEPMDEFNEYL